MIILKLDLPISLNIHQYKSYNVFQVGSLERMKEFLDEFLIL